MVGQRSSRSGWTIPGEFKGLAAKTTFVQHIVNTTCPTTLSDQVNIVVITFTLLSFYFSSRDLHPVGWAERTGHPLQEPLTPEEVGWLSTIARLNTFPFQGWLVFNQVKYWASRGGCPTPGCRGLGHIRGAKYSRLVKVRHAFSLLCQICIWF